MRIWHWTFLTVQETPKVSTRELTRNLGIYAQYFEVRTQKMLTCVEAGVLRRRIIGPFFVDNNLTTEKYLQLLQPVQQ